MVGLAFEGERPVADEAVWRRMAEAVLKGGDFEKKLVSYSADGIRIAPLYPSAKSVAPIIGRAPGAPWTMMQRVDDPSLDRAHEQALTDLENGATGLVLVFKGAISAHGFGLAADEEAVSRVLTDIYLDAGIDLQLDVGPRGRDAAQAVAHCCKARGVPPGSTRIRFGLDPIGQFALSGTLAFPWAKIAQNVAAAVLDLASQGFNGPFVASDGRVVHSAGGSEAQELAYVLSTALAYLRALEAAGVPLDAARGMIEFRLSSDADQFFSIAKHRALRRLWASIEAQCGLAPRPLILSSETAWRMTTRRDPWVNVLRGGMAAFAAGIGGADCVTVLPFTQALGLPDPFARRLARNTQLILLEESHLASVSDPVAGAGSFESLTEGLIEKAWALFQSLEAEGGIVTALEKGTFQHALTTVRDAHALSIAKRTAPITGLSEYADPAEKPVSVLAVRQEMEAALPYPTEVAMTQCALSPLRLAEPFERLRDASDIAFEKTGQRPTVFLATLGTVADYTPRAMFAKSLFEAGGIAATLPDGRTDLTALIAAFRASKTTFVCLCSTDVHYAASAVDVAKALRDAGAQTLWLAGRFGENEALFRAAGLSGVVFAGCNALTALNDAYAALGLGA